MGCGSDDAVGLAQADIPSLSLLHRQLYTSVTAGNLWPVYLHLYRFVDCGLMVSVKNLINLADIHPQLAALHKNETALL